MSTNSSIVIKPADKGGNIAIQNSTDYVQMCKRILDNPWWYRSIYRCAIDGFQKEFYALVDGAFYQSVIDKNTWEYIRTSFPGEATFYALPKIHKYHQADQSSQAEAVSQII